MGRHRRSAAGRAATGRAAEGHRTDGTAGSGGTPPAPGDRPTMGIAPYLNPEAYAEVRARSDAYLFASEGPDGDGGDGHPQAGRTVPFPSDGFAPDEGPQRAGNHRRRKRKGVTPVRTGLLGVSAAVALGTVAVATGAVPGLDNYRIGGGTSSDGGGRVQAQDAPTNTPSEQGGTSGSAETGRGGDAASRGAGRSSAPSESSPSGSASSSSPSGSSSSSAPSSPSASASKPAAPAETPSKSERQRSTPGTEAKPTPSRPADVKPAQPSTPTTASDEAVAQAQVLKLVNDERAKVGCSPVAANSALRELAENFSEAMAVQGFFDHTDPSGATPWDRAEAAGISDLGGENIARGQADAQSVMDAWMDSPGHKANILNCDFRTLGVGVHFGSGGPWWTQNFGY
ncbi:putative transmembrane protein [Streptomyces ambofaciens ATCC 23877]|uniref:Putative transmembrane protein n=1 Tax=Streptomyces ambofaciens (strain ATCC 23877 / 3486 / DSM 40053 / JCM 4204 / NBRC 12836 / NRRL B-2516) TaxID=278992 RepID=A0A0K2AZC6_STRA7|nr:CAP domain-containing protein [Streptomyces ambofaciens]AKZ58374.1 putative transmembrane protein [Streptomyces ambofaciens ATCC 23877]